jgi:adenylate cyclase
MAVQLSAYQEGIAHLKKGLQLLTYLPDSPKRDQQELALQLALGIAWVGPMGFDQEVNNALTRARQLCQELGETEQLCRVLGELSIYYYVLAEHHRARQFAEEALRLAKFINDPMLVLLDNSYLGFILFALGEYTTALNHFEKVIDFYDPERHHQTIVSLRGSDTGLSTLAYTACCLWCLGYPEHAEQLSQEALTWARELDHPFTLADVICFGGCIFNAMRQDVQALIPYALELKQLASDMLHGWLGQGILQWGEALAMQGHLDDGIAQMQEGLSISQSLVERF